MIIWVDVMNDKLSRICGDYRQNSVIPFLNSPIAANHTEGAATRLNLHSSMEGEAMGLVSCSGHALYNRIGSSDGQYLFSTFDIDIDDKYQKLIHLLACYAGDELGEHLVDQGCKAFFGYNDIFTIPFDSQYDDLVPFFLEPDKVLDVAISNGDNVTEAHNKVISTYEKNKIELRKRKAPVSYRAKFNLNQKCFCSPVVNKKYGDKNATIANIV